MLKLARSMDKVFICVGTVAGKSLCFRSLMVRSCSIYPAFVLFLWQLSKCGHHASLGSLAHRVLLEADSNLDVARCQSKIESKQKAPFAHMLSSWLKEYINVNFTSEWRWSSNSSDAHCGSV
eukprot:5928350-Amphidinium_carterae.1